MFPYTLSLCKPMRIAKGSRASKPGVTIVEGRRRSSIASPEGGHPEDPAAACLGAEEGRKRGPRARGGENRISGSAMGFTWDATRPSSSVQPPLVERHATAWVAAQAPVTTGARRGGAKRPSGAPSDRCWAQRTLTSPRSLRVAAAAQTTRPAWRALLTDAVAPDGSQGDHGPRWSPGLTAPGAARTFAPGGDAPGDPIKDPGAGGGPGGKKRGAGGGHGGGGPAEGTRPYRWHLRSRRRGMCVMGDEQKRPVEGRGGKSLLALSRADERGDPRARGGGCPTLRRTPSGDSGGVTRQASPAHRSRVSPRRRPGAPAQRDSARQPAPTQWFPLARRRTQAAARHGGPAPPDAGAGQQAGPGRRAPVNSPGRSGLACDQPSRNP